MTSLLKKLTYAPTPVVDQSAPTNEDFLHLIKAWYGPICIYLCTADYNIAVEVKRESLISEFSQYAPKNEPCKYRVNIINYEEGKTLILRELNCDGV